MLLVWGGDGASPTDLEHSMTTYWRIDHQGWPLSRSFRSADINDDDVLEQGTSCCESLQDLLRHGGYARGPVTIVAFRGQLVATGGDGEPVVIPSEEVARWEHVAWDGLGRDEDGYPIEAEDIDEDGLPALGWTPAELRPVAE